MIRLLFVLLFASLTAFSAFVAIKVPFVSYGMPRTLPGAELLYQVRGVVFGSHMISGQLPMVWMAGALLGARRGGLAMALYLALGLGGLPIFTSGGGFRYLGEPTFGYLLAFLPAVVVVGAFARDQHFGKTWRGMFYGLLIVEGTGLVYELAVRHMLFSPAAWMRLGWSQVLQFMPGYLALMTTVAFIIATARKADAAYLAWKDGKRAEGQEAILPTAG